MENEREEKAFIRTTIDLPPTLNAKLMQEAERTKRSRHSQMLIALEKFFETRDGNARKEKAK